MFELVPIGLALTAVCIASYTDLKSRIIPNRLTYPLIGAGIAFHALLGVSKGNAWTAAGGAFGAALAFLVGYALWLVGGWAGGDVKLFTALGALMPFYDAPVVRAPYPFPLTIFLNGIVAMIPIISIYAIICRARGRGVLHEQVRISELREGMIPAEVIYVYKGKVGRWSPGRFKPKPKFDKALTNPRRAAGLTRYEVGLLRRLARGGKLADRIRIRKGMPFAPALGLSVAISVLFGDLYWYLIQTLVNFFI